VRRCARSHRPVGSGVEREVGLLGLGQHVVVDGTILAHAHHGPASLVGGFPVLRHLSGVLGVGHGVDDGAGVAQLSQRLLVHLGQLVVDPHDPERGGELGVDVTVDHQAHLVLHALGLPDDARHALDTLLVALALEPADEPSRGFGVEPQLHPGGVAGARLGPHVVDLELLEIDRACAHDALFLTGLPAVA